MAEDDMELSVPDLTGLDLDELREDVSPALLEVLRRLVDGVGPASEAVAGFNSSM